MGQARRGSVADPGRRRRGLQVVPPPRHRQQDRVGRHRARRHGHSRRVRRARRRLVGEPRSRAFRAAQRVRPRSRAKPAVDVQHRSARMPGSEPGEGRDGRSGALPFEPLPPCQSRGERNRHRTRRRQVAGRISGRGPQSLNDGDDIVTSDSPSLTERLATFWARTGYDDLPKDVVDGIKDHILDTLAVALVGTTTPEVRGVVDALSRFSAGDAGSLVWGTGTRLTPAHAALVNGTSAHARDFDDGGGPGHAGSTVLPAALAVAEKAGSTGRQVIAATVAGYDIGYRTLQAVGGFAAHTDRGWHSSGTMGSFAAAAAAAKCLDADK